MDVVVLADVVAGVHADGGVEDGTRYGVGEESGVVPFVVGAGFLGVFVERREVVEEDAVEADYLVGEDEAVERVFPPFFGFFHCEVRVDDVAAQELEKNMRVSLKKFLDGENFFKNS